MAEFSSATYKDVNHTLAMRFQDEDTMGGGGMSEDDNPDTGSPLGGEVEGDDDSNDSGMDLGGGDATSDDSDESGDEEDSSPML